MKIYFNAQIATIVLVAVIISGRGYADQPIPNPATAEDVSLAAFGLSDIKPLASPEADRVRGEGGIAETGGISFVSGFLIDSNSTSSVFGLDANSAGSTVTVQAPIRRVQPIHQHQSQLELSLTVNEFLGTILGGSGGAASAIFR